MDFCRMFLIPRKLILVGKRFCSVVAIGSSEDFSGEKFSETKPSVFAGCNGLF
jgi:hypothetical protein